MGAQDTRARSAHVYRPRGSGFTMEPASSSGPEAPAAHPRDVVSPDAIQLSPRLRSWGPSFSYLPTWVAASSPGAPAAALRPGLRALAFLRPSCGHL